MTTTKIVKASRRRAATTAKTTTPWQPKPVPPRPTVAALAAGVANTTLDKRQAGTAAVAELLAAALELAGWLDGDRGVGFYDRDKQIELSRDRAALEDVRVVVKLAAERLAKAGYSSAHADFSDDRLDTCGDALRCAATVADRVYVALFGSTAWFMDGTAAGATVDQSHLYPHLAADKKAKRVTAAEAVKRKPKALAAAKPRFDFAGLPPRVEAGC